MRTSLHCVASLVFGYLLLGPLGAIYGAAGLPVYHSWGILHGGFETALPALVAAVFVALGAVPWWGKTNDVFPRLVACASVLAFVTTLFWADQRSHFSLSAWHAVIYVAVFALFLFLCMRSQRTLLVPLFLVVPLFYRAGLRPSDCRQVWLFHCVRDVWRGSPTPGPAGSHRNRHRRAHRFILASRRLTVVMRPRNGAG
jgi:hypothetical protein